MFSKMSVIAFTVGLVATLCVTDVNAVVYETCKFSDAACTQEVKGSCLAGLAQPDIGKDYYDSRQTGYGEGPNPLILGAKDHKTCKAFFKAQWKRFEEIPDGDYTDGYTEKSYIAEREKVDCYSSENDDGTYYGQRCGASFTGSSMAALFGLLCVSLALW